ncbi:MAG: MFS transporter [Actinomycetes bacterium]
MALPQVRGEYRVNLHELQWVGVSFLLAQAIILIAAGRVGDRVGRRPVFMVGMVLVFLGSVAAAAAPANGWLVAARIVEGVGAGILVSGSFAIVRDNVSTEMLGQAFGLWAMVAGIGGWLVGPVVYGALTNYSSWRWVMVLNAVLALVALVLTPQFIPGGRPSTIFRPSFRRLLRGRNYVIATLTIAPLFTILSLLWFTMIIFLFTVHALTPLEIGLVALAYGIPYALLPVATGRLADRIGVRRPLLVGFGLIFSSMVVLSIAAEGRDLLVTIVAVAVTGAGVAFVTPALNGWAFRLIHIEDRSDASGLNFAMRLIGSAIGVVIATIMLESISNTSKPTFGVVAGYDVAAAWIWAVAAGVSLIAMVVVLVGVRTPGGHQGPGGCPKSDCRCCD